jgi:hypothetical protein
MAEQAYEHRPQVSFMDAENVGDESEADSFQSEAGASGRSRPRRRWRKSYASEDSSRSCVIA